MFTVQSRVEFDAAHFLVGSNSPCDMLHGHRWKVDVVLQSESLTKAGFVINFTELKSWMKEMTENIDHNLANFYLPQSTAENLCLYFAMFISDKLVPYNKANRMKVEVQKVIISETPNNTATYQLYVEPGDVRKERLRNAAITQWADPEKRAKIQSALRAANDDPELRHIRSMRMFKDNPMSKRDVITKMMQSLRKSKKVYPNNSEQKMIAFFEENNIPLTYCGDGNFILDGKIPDFVNHEKKVVVEYNSRFWHSKNEWNDAYDDSEERKAFFAERGYTLYVIWDDEFDSKKEQIKNELLNLLK